MGSEASNECPISCGPPDEMSIGIPGPRRRSVIASVSTARDQITTTRSSGNTSTPSSTPKDLPLVISMDRPNGRPGGAMLSRRGDLPGRSSAVQPRAAVPSFPSAATGALPHPLRVWTAPHLPPTLPRRAWIGPCQVSFVSGRFVYDVPCRQRAPIAGRSQHRFSNWSGFRRDRVRRRQHGRPQRRRHAQPQRHRGRDPPK